MRGLHSAVGCNVAMLEYRGYGKSDGTPSEEGLYMDAQVMYTINVLECCLMFQCLNH